MGGTDAMTKEEFEAGYAARSGVTVEWLREHHLMGFVCDCGEKGCQGWMMGHELPEGTPDFWWRYIGDSKWPRNTHTRLLRRELSEWA